MLGYQTIGPKKTKNFPNSSIPQDNPETFLRTSVHFRGWLYKDLLMKTA
jgi:hypothetical protein